MVRREGGELRGARVDGLEHRPDAEGVAQAADHGLAHAAQRGDLLVGEAVALGPAQGGLVERGDVRHLAGDVVDEADLVEEPRVDAARVVHLLDRGPGPQRLLDGDEPVLGRLDRGRDERVEVDVRVERREPERGAAPLQRAHRLLQGLGEAAPDGHGLADGLHGRGEGLVRGRELLEREARDLDDDVVQRRLEARRGGAGDVVGDLVEGVADGQARGDLGDGEPGRLGGQRAGAGHPRVHLDDDDPAVDGVRPRTGCCSRRCRPRPRG